MSRRHDRARYGAVQAATTAFYLARSAFAATREPIPTPRHARHNSPRSAR